MRTLLLLLIACSLGAQKPAQFVWRGEVSGTVTLRLRDNRLEVLPQGNARVEKQQFEFRAALPEVRQNARLELVEGRGYVHISDQPRLENGYSLSLAIEDRQSGSSPYSVAVYWDSSNSFFEGARSSGRMDKLAWSGRVDGQAIISCRARQCVSEARNGVPASDEHFKFTRPLPDRAVEVRLEEALGRGDIRVVEQPSERNQYTARVAISDLGSGAGEYSFTLAWSRPTGKEARLRLVQPGLIWSAVVDGRVRVTVQGGAAFSEVIAGHPVTGERAEFLHSLPTRSDLEPKMKKLRGRVEVQIIESPSERNNYRLIFEVQSADGVKDACEVEVDW